MGKTRPVGATCENVLFFFNLYQQPTVLVLVGVCSEGSEELVWQVSQVEEGSLGISLEVRQLLDCRGQNIHVTLVVTT